MTSEAQAVVATASHAAERAVRRCGCVGVPVFLWAILAEHDALALAAALSSPGSPTTSTARSPASYGLVSRVGQLLDPVADRLYIVSTLLGLAWREIIPWWLVGLLFAREVFMGVVVLVAQAPRLGRACRCTSPARRRPSTSSTPSRCSCSATARARSPRSPQPVGWAFAWWGTGLYWARRHHVCRPAWQLVVRARAASAARDGTVHLAPPDPAAHNARRASARRVDDPAHVDDGAPARPRVRRGRASAVRGRPAGRERARAPRMLVAALVVGPARSALARSRCAVPTRRVSQARPELVRQIEDRRAEVDARRAQAQRSRAESTARRPTPLGGQQAALAERARRADPGRRQLRPCTGPGFTLTLDDARGPRRAGSRRPPQRRAGRRGPGAGQGPPVRHQRAVGGRAPRRSASTASG